MKRFMKLLPVICLLVFLCGVTVSADEAQITADVVKLGTENVESFAGHSYSYGKNDIVNINGASYCGKIIPIYVSEPGKLYFAFDENSSLSTSVQVCFLSNRNSAYGSTYTYSASSIKSGKHYAQVDTVGTYYILLNSSSYYSSITTNTLSFRSYVVSNNYGTTPVSVSGDAGKTKNVTFYKHDYTVSGKELYIKYQAKAAGYVTITPKVGSGYVTLCNSKKKDLSGQKTLNVSSSYASNKKVTYGVVKGTYYIKVKTYDDQFSLNIKLTKISESSGSSKKKAKTIAVNKTRKGTIVAGNNKVDWYKFKLTKSSKVTINVSGATDGSFKITVYKGNSSKGYTYLYDDFSAKLQSVKQFSSTRTKFAKGTYYIKVERYYAKSSGYYSIKWQKK